MAIGEPHYGWCLSFGLMATAPELGGAATLREVQSGCYVACRRQHRARGRSPRDRGRGHRLHGPRGPDAAERQRNRRLPAAGAAQRVCPPHRTSCTGAHDKAGARTHAKKLAAGLKCNACAR